MSNRPSTSSTTHTQQIVPTVPPAIHALAAPTPSLIDSQLPVYLLPCVLALLRESAGHVVRRKRREENELREEGLLPAVNGKGKGKASEEEISEVIEGEALKRVERIGLMVGGYIAEKLTLARPPLASHLDIIKFICKDLFLYVYSKQIDNLRTNHRGVFVLQSHAFPPLVPLSSYRGAASDAETAKAHLIYPQALVQGALGRLGMPAFVTAESAGLSQCTFQIRTVKSTQIPFTPSSPPGLNSTPGIGNVLPIPSGPPGQIGRPASAGLGKGTT